MVRQWTSWAHLDRAKYLERCAGVRPGRMAVRAAEHVETRLAG